MSVLYAQTSGNLNTGSVQPTPMPGLSLELPGGVGIMAIVTLNVPNPYAEGSNYPGGGFALSINGQLSPVIACFTYIDATPSSSGRMPTTLVVGVPLIEQSQTVQAMWNGVRGIVSIDSPATLSAVIDD